jgi:late embryogenesis abundant protein
MLMARRLICSVLAGFLFVGCATLQQLSALVQAPRFEQAPDRDPEIRLVGPGSGMPIGGAAIRLWTRVTNPNAFSLTLGTLKGTLYLEDSRAADADFPLGLPLNGGGETIVPIDLSVSFASIPGLADSIRRAINRQPLPYHLDGTVGVDAGRLGQPIFGPMTLLRGEIGPRSRVSSLRSPVSGLGTED